MATLDATLLGPSPARDVMSVLHSATSLRCSSSPSGDVRSGHPIGVVPDPTRGCKQHDPAQFTFAGGGWVDPARGCPRAASRRLQWVEAGAMCRFEIASYERRPWTGR